MKVLLTGYAGFLGRHCARALQEAGHQVRTVLYRRTVPRRECLEEVAEVLWGSLEEPELVRRAVAGVDAVIHGAWSFEKGAQRPSSNERAAELLWRESTQDGVQVFVFISSVAVYGMSGTRDTPLSEDAPYAAGSEAQFSYPAEKIAVETLLRGADRRGTRLVILRPGPIMDDHKGPGRVVRLGGLKLAVGLGHGRNHLPMIHAADVASAAVQCLALAQACAVFNVTPSVELRQRDFVRRWHKVAAGRKVAPLFVPGFVARLGAWGVNLLKRVLGKPGKTDVRYALACATRDLRYSNAALGKAIGWQDLATRRYTTPAPD